MCLLLISICSMAGTSADGLLDPRTEELLDRLLNLPNSIANYILQMVYGRLAATRIQAAARGHLSWFAQYPYLYADMKNKYDRGYSRRQRMAVLRGALFGPRPTLAERNEKVRREQGDSVFRQKVASLNYPVSTASQWAVVD